MLRDSTISYDDYGTHWGYHLSDVPVTQAFLNEANERLRTDPSPIARFIRAAAETSGMSDWFFTPEDDEAGLVYLEFERSMSHATREQLDEFASWLLLACQMVD